jgi:hypothetical protein
MRLLVLLEQGELHQFQGLLQMVAQTTVPQVEEIPLAAAAPVDLH